jgi:MFS family permease
VISCPTKAGMKLAEVETKHLALVICVLISDLFFTGLVFGWAPLLLMLQEEHQYSELCAFPDMKCKAQENKLNLMFALASVAANIAALPVGMFLDYFGPKVAVGVAGVVEISGLLLMAYSESQSFDFFVQGYVLLAFGGCITMMASYPSSFLIVKYQTAILAAISCLFDGSSVVFLLLYSIRSAFGVSRKSLFLCYAIAGLLVYFLLVYLWGLNEKSFLEEEKEVIEEQKSLLDESIPKNSPVSDKEAKELIRDYAIQYGTLNEEEFIGRKSAEDVKKVFMIIFR